MKLIDTRRVAGDHRVVVPIITRATQIHLADFAVEAARMLSVSSHYAVGPS